jgi:hypothetical protein
MCDDSHLPFFAILTTNTYMKLESLPTSAPPAHGRCLAAPLVRFAALLALVLAVLAAAVRPSQNGDFPEYALMTVALANHASPDIRPSDIAAARVLQPEFGGAFDVLGKGMREQALVPVPGFFRGNDGNTYAIHFFAYPALAAVPFRLLQALGANPFKCFQAVNLAMVFVLGLALYRLFGNGRHAALGLLAFALCGAMLYWQWSSPETMSAAALLAGLILYTTGAPLAGGLLAGLAAMQNPPIGLFCAFAPLLRLCLGYRPELGLVANLKAALAWRFLLGAAASAALYALPVLFNLYAFSTPSIIAKGATSTFLITPNRLHSFFFDLNQGVLVGVPAIALALALWWPTGARARALAVTCGALAFAVALAVPSLAAQNWNSAAAGIMRYALWGAMPLLFAFLWRLRAGARWPAGLLLAVLAVQAGAMYHARQYNELEFSPLAKSALAHAPGWYNPDPEIFYERVTHGESFPEPEKTFAYRVDGTVVKTLYNERNPAAATTLCGPGRALAPDNRSAGADTGWRYINGPPRCVRRTDSVSWK